MENKSIDLILEQAKIDYVNAINEINKKYNLSIVLVELLLSNIYKDVLLCKLQSVEEIKKEAGNNGI